MNSDKLLCHKKSNCHVWRDNRHIIFQMTCHKTFQDKLKSRRAANWRSHNWQNICLFLCLSVLSVCVLMSFHPTLSFYLCAWVCVPLKFLFSFCVSAYIVNILFFSLFLCTHFNFYVLPSFLIFDYTLLCFFQFSVCQSLYIVNRTIGMFTCLKENTKFWHKISAANFVGETVQ